MLKLKLLNYYTRIFTLPTTLKQALLLEDPVHEESIFKKENINNNHNKMTF